MPVKKIKTVTETADPEIDKTTYIQSTNGNFWDYMLVAFITTVVVGGTAVLIHNNRVTALENRHQIAIEEMEDRLREYQFQEELEDTKEEILNRPIP